MMQSLAVKYRPQTFEDVVEQDNIKLILQEQLATNTYKNCYLFTGGAGTGKTTCARIFASELNQHEGNAIEIDAASNNGVENVREIITNAKFKALDSMYKVYIIDECHMLSTGAWNAMLKILEEPPAQTMFILCTTDPQKIPATILSRVQRYDFRRISFKSIVTRLKFICEQEGLSLYDEDGGPEYIAKLADGGMRDAITMLDKCVSFSEEIVVANVIAALGTTDYEEMFDLTQAIVDMRADAVVVIIEEIHRRGVDLKQFMKQYSYFVLDLCKYDLLGSFDYLQIPSTFQNKFISYMAEDYRFFRVLLDAVINLNSAIKWETMPKPLIEATLMLLCKQEEYEVMPA